MTTQALTLRRWQQEALDAFWRAVDLEDTPPSLLVHASTGSGKTVFAWAVIDAWLREHPGDRVVVMARGTRLVHQWPDDAEKFFPHLFPDIGIVQAENDGIDQRIIIANDMTLANDNRLLAVTPPGLLILDEAHHATAETWLKVVGTWADAVKLGLTATPGRTDKVALGLVFDRVLYRYNILDAIAAGDLAPTRAYGYGLAGVDFKKLRRTKDGWDDDQVGAVLDADNIHEIVLAKWVKHDGPNRPTLAFAASVTQAHHGAEYFTRQGYPSVAIDWRTPDWQRVEWIGQLRRGELASIWNRFVLTEGVDIPEASLALNLAPTTSATVYTQRMGRVLRSHPTKEYAVILDFAPRDHDIVFAGDVLAGLLPSEVEDSVKAAEDAGMPMFAFQADKAGIGVIAPGDVVEVMLNFGRKSKLAWDWSGKYQVASLSRNVALAIAPPRPDSYEQARGYSARAGEMMLKFGLYLISRVTVGGMRQWKTEEVALTRTLDELKPLIKDLTDQWMDKDWGRNAAWRKAGTRATQEQIDFLVSLYGNNWVNEHWEGLNHEYRGKDWASRFITAKLAERAVADRRRRLAKEKRNGQG